MVFPFNGYLFILLLLFCLNLLNGWECEMIFKSGETIVQGIGILRVEQLVPSTWNRSFPVLGTTSSRCLEPPVPSTWNY